MKKTLLLLAIALLTAVSSFAETATLVTNTSDLVAGGKYVIACPSKNVAMTAENPGKFFKPVDVTIKDNAFTFNASDNVAVIELVKSGDNWNLKLGEQYLVSTVEKTIKLGTTGTDVTIAFAATSTTLDFGKAGKLVYNAAASGLRFTTYTSEQTAVALYKVGAGDAPGLTVAAPTFTPVSGNIYADDKVTIDCATEGAVITYTVNGGESQAYPAEGISFSEDGPYTIKATATLTKDGEKATADAEATYTYQIVKPKAIGAVQVTSIANIIEGAEYILAHKKTDGNFVVMGATIGNNAAGTKPYINHVDKVQPNDDESITVDRTSHGIISFESDEANGRWYLAVPNAGGYIKSMLNEASGRYCKFSENPEHSATVNINNEGKAEIIFKDGDNDAYFLANPGASRFTCYESATVGNTFTPALYALPAEDMSFSVVGPDDAEVSSNIDINGYKNEATGNYYTITVSYPKGTALYYRTTSYHMMVNGVDVLKPVVVDDKEIIPVLGEFKLAPKAEAAAAAASVAAESGMNTAVIGLARKGDFELRLQDAAGNASETKSYKIDGNATGVEDIAVDGVEDGEAVYYNMQGVRVANPAAGSLYIRVQGSKAAKVLVK